MTNRRAWTNEEMSGCACILRPVARSRELLQYSSGLKMRRQAKFHGWKFPTIRQLRSKASGTHPDVTA
jgi:hypothetical protein